MKKSKKNYQNFNTFEKALKIISILLCLLLEIYENLSKKTRATLDHPGTLSEISRPRESVATEKS